MSETKTAPINLIAHIPCPKENLQRVRRLLEEYGVHVRQMDGAQRFEVYSNRDGSGLVVLERYRDQAAFDLHMADPENTVLNDALAKLTPGGSHLTFLDV